MFLGNVVTNRINADRIVWHGSTPEAKELPDFLVSADPWFRPTDIKLGPDGALYVADFYNRIIGHYEVDLHHPLRDKDHGRVWRIVWTGTDGEAKPPTMAFKNLATTDLLAAFHLSGHANMAVRQLATLELIRRRPKEIPPQYRGAPATAFSLANWGWVSEVNGSPPDSNLSGVLKSPVIEARIVALRVATARQQIAADLRTTICAQLTPDAAIKDDHLRWTVVRAATAALAAHPHADNVAPLAKLIASCPKDDTHLLYAARMALRNTLRDAPGAWDAAAKADPAIIGDVAAAVPSKAAADYSLQQVKAGHAEPRFCEHVGRYGDDAQAAAVVAAIRAKPASVFAVQALVRGVQARGGKAPAGTAAIAEVACTRALKNPNAFTVAAATDLAAHLKLADLFEPLARFAAGKHEVGQRGSALAALMAIDPAKATPILGKVLTAPNARPALRTRAAKALAESNQPAAHAALVAALQTVPARLAVTIAVALADSPRGANTLLDAVQQGKASARLLQMTAVALRLHAIDGGKLKPRVEALTRGLPSADARLAEVLKARAANFRTAQPDAKRGQAVFTQHCAACHQIGGQGAKVGPQLDGIGNRGLERVLEDVLDSNRNVDAAFRATVVNTLDGRTITGLVLREEGQVLVLADSAGKEVRIEAKDIDKRTSSPLSPMPANFDTAIPEADFQHLIAYLLTQRAKP
jgi:putative heme-binding domain-containing protein